MAEKKPTNLYEYYQTRGETLPSFSDRRAVARQVGIDNYRGTAEQNQQLLNNLMRSEQTTPMTDLPGGLSVGTGGTPSNFALESSGIKSSSAVSSNAAREEIGQITNRINSIDAVPERPATDRENITNALMALDGEEGAAYEDFTDAINNIRDYGVDFSREETRMLNDIQNRYDILRRRQIVANQSLEGGFETSQAVSGSGISRYAPELAMIELNGVVQAGIDRLRDIELEAQEKLAEAKDAITQGRIDAIRESYDGYVDRIKARRDTLSELRLNLNDYERNEREKERIAISRSRLELDRDKDKNTNNVVMPDDIPEELMSVVQESGLADLSVEDFVNQLESDTPPAWFNNMIAKTKRDGFQNISTLKNKQIRDAWEAFRESDFVSEYRNIGAPGSSSGGFDVNALP